MSVVGEVKDVRRTQNLQHLYIGNCHKHGAKANSKLCTTLNVGAADLTSLDLASNYTGTDNGFTCLVSVLAAAPQMQELDLSDNYLTSDNVKELVAHLLHHPSLHTLSLLNNRLYIASGKELLRLARQNHTIKHIKIATSGVRNDNKVPDKILSQIERELQQNRARQISQSVRE